MVSNRQGMTHSRDTRVSSSILAASFWMIGITLVLFFVPLLNGFTGGFVGGYKVGGASRALLVAVLPAIVVGVAVWLLAPLWGIAAGSTVALLVLFADFGIFIGALFGGAMGARPGPAYDRGE